MDLFLIKVLPLQNPHMSTKGFLILTLPFVLMIFILLLLIKGREFLWAISLRLRGVNPLRRQPSSSFVPTCHLCSIVGHICPHCLMLRSSAPKKETTPPMTNIENLRSKMKDVVRRLDKLKGVRTVPTRKRYRSKKVEIPYTLGRSDKRPT